MLNKFKGTQRSKTIGFVLMPLLDKNYYAIRLACITVATLMVEIVLYV